MSLISHSFHFIVTESSLHYMEDRVPPAMLPGAQAQMCDGAMYLCSKGGASVSSVS